MLANALIFVLGLFISALAALIFAPVLWRKAQRLARREFDATVPISANEIRAEFDRVRAEAALTVRRQEVLSAETRAKAAKSEAERGRTTIENAELVQRAQRIGQALAEREEELAGTRAALATRDEDFNRLVQELGAVRHDAELTAQELEALGKRFRELTDIAEERKIQLVAAEAKLDRLSDTMRESNRNGREEKVVVERLNAEIAALERTLKQEHAGTSALQEKVADLVGRLADREEEIARLRPPPPSFASPLAPTRSRSAWGGDAAAPASAGESAARTPAPRVRRAAADAAETADIRERISDIAARVIRMTALAEGPQSPIAGLLSEPPGRPDHASGAARRPTLADRVRLLAEADRGAGR